MRVLMDQTIPRDSSLVYGPPVYVPPWVRAAVPWLGTPGFVPLPFGAAPPVEVLGRTCASALLLSGFVLAVGKLFLAILVTSLR